MFVTGKQIFFEVLLKRATLTLETDPSLLASLRAGDADSFEHLAKASSSRLLATAYRILGREQDAQDAVQETLISAWKNIRAFEGTSSISTWLHRIVVNASLAKLRSTPKKSEVSMGDGTTFEGLPTAWAEAGPNIERQVALRDALQRALNQIPEEFRVVLILRDVENMSSREVADQLEIPDATVRQRLHRARATMAELLRPELCNGPELTCGGQFQLLMDYIDHALPPELQAPVHDHIEGCPVCAELHRIYRVTIGFPIAVMQTEPMLSMPEDWVHHAVTMALNAG